MCWTESTVNCDGLKFQFKSDTIYTCSFLNLSFSDLIDFGNKNILGYGVAAETHIDGFHGY
jgi:hypothetical protein